VFRLERVVRQKGRLTKTKMPSKPDWQETMETLDITQTCYQRQLIKFIEHLEPNPMQESWVENIIKVFASRQTTTVIYYSIAGYAPVCK